MLASLAHASGEATNGLPPGLSAAPNFTTLVNALRRRWLLAVSLSLLAAALTVTAVLFLVPAQYVAHVRFRIAMRNPDVVHEFGGEDGNEFLVYKNSQAALACSPLVLTRALKERLPDGREIRDLPMIRALGSGAVEWLEKALKPDFLAGPEYLRISLGGDDPEEVTALLNAISKAYLETNKEQTANARTALVEEYKDRKRQLEEEHRKLLAQLNNEMAAGSVKERDALTRQLSHRDLELSQAIASLRSIRNHWEEAKTDLATLEGRLHEIPKLALPPEKLDEALKADPTGASHYQQMVEIEKQIQRFKETSRNPGPAVRNLQDSANDVRKSLNKRRDIIRPEVEVAYRNRVANETKEAIATTTIRIRSLANQEQVQLKEVQELTAAVQALEQKIKNKPTSITVLEDKVGASKSALDDISKRVTLYDFHQPPARVQLLQDAAVPTRKDYSRQFKIGGG
jgi:hypothetical protein